MYVRYWSFLRKREKEISSIADLDEVASSEDSDEPGTTCKKEALVEVHDDLVDSDKETLIFNQ